MGNSAPQSYRQLQIQIEQLQAVKAEQEALIQSSFRDFTLTLTPLSILKGSLSGFKSDPALTKDILKTGLNVSTDFLVDKVLYRSGDIKRLFLSVLVKKIAAPLINNSVTKLLSRFGKLKQPAQGQGHIQKTS